MLKRYKTENAKIATEMPRQTRQMTAQEIVEYMREHFKTNLSDNGLPEVPANKATAYLMAVSKAIFDPTDWRNPIYAVMPQCGNEWAKAAIIWYHGAKPLESFVGVYSNGYACW